MRIKTILFSILAVFGLWIFFSSFTIIGAGERGVVLRLGAVQDTVLGEGFHLVLPIVNSVVEIDVKTQKAEVPAPSFSRDLQNVMATIAMNYHLDPKSVNRLWQEIGVDFEDRIISPAIQESVKAATARFTAAEMVSERPRVKEEIAKALRERLEGRFIVVDDVSIVNLDFSDSYEKSIEEKQVAQQDALKAENDLRRIEIEAQQKIASARAEAESIKIRAEALQQNQKLVDLEAIKKWDGKLPTYVMGGGIPLINLPAGGHP